MASTAPFSSLYVLWNSSMEIHLQLTQLNCESWWAEQSRRENTWIVSRRRVIASLIDIQDITDDIIYTHHNHISTFYMTFNLFSYISILLLFILAPASPPQQYTPLPSFGMNKPHLLFHLGQRTKISVNHGFGYWQNHPNKNNRDNFSKIRMYYQNTKNGLYVDVKSHDGGSHFEEKIEDRTYGVESQVKYQIKQEQGWEYQLSMDRNDSQKDINSSSTYWMTYMTVQNTDHNLIPQLDSVTKTPITFELLSSSQNQAKIQISHLNGPSELITVSSSPQTKINTFGFSMNISETYDIRNSLQEVKYLVQLQRYKMKKRKNDSEIVQWENQQLKIMKEGKWTNKKYVVFVLYGEFEEKCQLHVTNTSRKEFNEQQFNNKKQELNEKYFPEETYPEHSAFLRHILYNLFGGQAFYQGTLYTQNSLLRHEFSSTFSFTPSRLIFPRGFLWDDGFHLSVSAYYQPSLTINILKSWLDKIDLFGWIGREQIRGSQMGSLMPQVKFIYQDIFQMNPPTLIMPILTLINSQQQLSESVRAQLNRMLTNNFWKLQKWYRYFVKTQSHLNLIQPQAINKTLKYRWRCKDDCQRGNFMGSGLDDYPRMENQAQISKQHVDLLSWLHFFSQGLQNIAGYLKLEKPRSYYGKKKDEFRNKIYEECLDAQDLVFKDQTVKAKNQFINHFVDKYGYINLFPFLAGTLRQQEYPQSQQKRVLEVRNKLIQIMSDPDLLFSEDGLRSLSKSDLLYGTLDNYWRGAVWMPINYMVLRACKLYYWDDEYVRTFYYELRQRLITSIKRNWQQTGYLFENYHHGKGHRGFPFYGWTSIIINVITEQY